jgi:hypothetical protein
VVCGAGASWRARRVRHDGHVSVAAAAAAAAAASTDPKGSAT